MVLRRRSLLLSTGALALAGIAPLTYAQSNKTLKLGITLEPPGLDPTVSAASSIAEITLYNVYETLTKIQPDGKVVPLLAKAWEVSGDVKAYTFTLVPGVKFHNGADFNAHTVKFSLERAGAQNSTNKDRQVFASIERIVVVDEHTVRLELKNADADLPFKLGMATAIMVEPESVAGNRTRPVGTGPYLFGAWRKGATLTLNQWPQYRVVAQIAVKQATFMFISDAAAQATALLAGDVDVFARAAIARSLATFKRQPGRFQVLVSNSRAKTILAMNNRRPPLNNLKVRQAITAAIDRNAVIEAAADGFGVPIGSHYVPGMPGYVDTTGTIPYNPEIARTLLKEAGVAAPLSLKMVLPPAPYARQGGEIIAAMLSQVGIQARIQNVEWAQWLSGVMANYDYDLSIISHVEPLDLDNYTKPHYYWGYQSQAFNTLYAQIQQTPDEQTRNVLLAQAQQMLANDAVNVWLYQPQWLTVANARIKGLWSDMPIFVKDLSSMSWA